MLWCRLLAAAFLRDPTADSVIAFALPGKGK
jgi:hypothetical protein